MRARWGTALKTSLVLALTLAFAGPAAAASATAPVTIGQAYVLDEVGALTSAQKATAEQQLEDLSDATNAQLYVVIVDAFTDPSDYQQWADAVAQDNGFGPSQYVLVISTETRQYYISADTAGPMSDSQLSATEAAIRPLLRDGDYAGAISTAADSFTTALNGSTSGRFPVGLIFVIVGSVVIALVVWLIVRRRTRKPVAGPSAAPEIDVKELARQASSALVQTDDAVKTSEQELGFARAQFGDAAAAEFDKALQVARDNLTQAFTLKQQLDDSVPDAEADTRTWNTEIIRLCEEANAGLDEKSAAFDELRKLEQNAPEALAPVTQQRAEAAASIDAARARLQKLSERYAPEALSTIADNPEQAAQRLAFAEDQLTAAATAITAGENGEAAVSIRAAEDAVGQAVLLETAIEKLGTDLAAGETSAAALITELERDIATASTLPDPDGRVATAIAATRQQVDAARANLAGTALRPLITLQSLEAANTQIDGVVQGVRDAAASAQRAQQLLGQQLLQAQAQVSAAEDYITSRRGAIGAEARTRLAEAGAALVQAQQLQTSSPEQALQYAQRANQLAGQAIQHAQNDVGAFDGGFGGLTGGGNTGGNNGGMLGAVLGGIVINSLLGGGSSSGGGRSSSSRSSGGGLFGGSGRSGGGRSGGGRMSPGSFGGGGTRGRRGGGRF